MIYDITDSTLDTNCQVGDVDATILPPDIFGISASGTNTDSAVCVQSINVSADFSRESFNCLGKRGVEFRAISFPLEVTTEIEIIGRSVDMVSAIEEGVVTGGDDGCQAVGNNLLNRTIRVAICESTRLYMGTKNKLQSVNYGGGDAGGGNVTISYTYTTFNDLTVLHENDPNPSGLADSWWANRATYLVDL